MPRKEKKLNKNMSKELFFTRGQTSAWRHVEILAANTTIAVWTPTTSTRIVLTGLDVSTSGAGSIRFSLGDLGGVPIAQYFLSSATVTPRFDGIESTMYDRGIYAVASSALGGGWKITATGFELP